MPMSSRLRHRACSQLMSKKFRGLKTLMTPKVREIQDRHAIKQSQIETGHAHLLHLQHAASHMREAEHTAQVDRLKAEQAEVLQQIELQCSAEIDRLKAEHKDALRQFETKQQPR